MLWAFKQNPDRSAEKLVLLELSNHAGTDNTAWPSLARICERTGLNRKTVISALDSLESKGYLSDTRERKGGTQQIKVYKLSLPGLNDTVPKTESYSERVPFFPETVPFFPDKSTENGTRNLLLNHKESIKEKNIKKENDSALPEGFAVFWDAYPKHPRKQSKGKCLEIWKRKKYEQHTQEIIRHLEFCKSEWKKDDNKYVPMPSSYLNKQGWDGWEPVEERSEWVTR